MTYIKVIIGMKWVPNCFNKNRHFNNFTWKCEIIWDIFMPCMPNICVTVGFQGNNYNLIKNRHGYEKCTKLAMNLMFIRSSLLEVFIEMNIN